MARIRTIKPEFWRDELLSGISSEAALLAIGLLNHCDDEGYFNANPKLVESDVFPLRKLKSNTTELLRELSGIGYIKLFKGADSKSYGKVDNFERHQVINKKTPSKIKDLCYSQEDYGSGVVALPSGKERKGKEMEGKAPKVAATSVACPPDVSKNVWDDWVALRKSKKTTVSETAIEGARKEAAKLGWTLEQFLVEWCTRGSQGLKADWIQPKQTFAQQAADIARTTVPSTQGPDPALIKIEQDLKKAVPMPDSIRQKILEVTKK